MTAPMPRLLRQMCWGLVIAFPLLVLFGQHWRNAAGGPGTQGVTAVADFICPAAFDEVMAVRVADGADALHRAVLRRIKMELHMRSGCWVPDKLPCVGAVRRRVRSAGE